MSLETEIKNLTAAVSALTQVMQAQAQPQPQMMGYNPMPPGNLDPRVQQPQQGFAQPGIPMPPSGPQTPGLPTMPAAPMFPAQMVGGNGQFPQAQAPMLPFNDTPSLVLWATAKYKALGPERGAQIQPLIQSMGFTALNQIPPDRFAQVYQAIEALGA